MYLYAEEVFRLPGNGDGSLEGQCAVDVRSVRLAGIGVARPITVAVPCKVVGGLAVLHDGRNTVIIIGLNVIILGCVFLGLQDILQLLLIIGQLTLQLTDLILVGIVLLAQTGCLFDCRRGYLLDKVGVLSFQLVYLCLRECDFIAVFRFQCVQFRCIDILIACK